MSNLFAALNDLAKAETGEDIVASARATAEAADAFAARATLTEPTGDVLTADEQAALDSVLAGLADLDVVLRGYQHAAVETVVSSVGRRAVLGLAPGLGKTLVTIATFLVERALGLDGSMLVVAPPTLGINWTHEVQRFAPGLTVAQMRGTKAGPMPEADVVIVPDSVLAARQDDVVAAVEAGRVGLLAVDEAQRMKGNRHAVRRAHAALLVAHAFHTARPNGIVLSLTGTLCDNIPADIYNPVALLGRRATDRVTAAQGWDPEIGATGYASFRAHWSAGELVRVQGKMVLKNITGCVDPARLNGELRTAGLITVDRHAVLDLPPMTWVPQHTECSSTMGKYREASQNFLAFVERHFGKRRAASAGRAEALAQIDHLRREAALAKTQATVEIVTGLVQQGESVVVFAHHTPAVLALSNAFAKAGVATTQIVGGMSAKQKHEAQEDYRSGRVPVIICNMQSAGVGLNLHGYEGVKSRTVVFHQLPWTPAMLVQCAGRVERVGQPYPCVAIIPLLTDEGSPTIDQRMWAAVNAKSGLADAIVTNGETTTIDNVEEDAFGAGSVATEVLATYGVMF